jgi:hypothetical protein
VPFLLPKTRFVPFEGMNGTAFPFELHGYGGNNNFVGVLKWQVTKKKQIVNISSFLMM